VSLKDGPLIRGLRELVADLGLDQRDFVVFGSGPLLAHGLFDDITDLDVVVRPGVWRRVLRYAAKRGKLVRGVHNGALIAQFDVGDDRCIQFSSGWISKEWRVPKLIADADEIDGVRFAKLDKVLGYKKVLRRSKDDRHIEILNSHLKKVEGSAPPLMSLGLDRTTKRRRQVELVSAGRRRSKA
jgi:hypothetical protein